LDVDPDPQLGRLSVRYSAHLLDKQSLWFAEHLLDQHCDNSLVHEQEHWRALLLVHHGALSFPDPLPSPVIVVIELEAYSSDRSLPSLMISVTYYSVSSCSAVCFPQIPTSSSGPTHAGQPLTQPQPLISCWAL